MQAERRLFYGWYVVAVSFLTMGMSVGLWYSYSVFFVALIKEFGQSRGVTAGAGAFNAVVAMAVMPFIGRLFDRLGSRRMLPAGAGVLALALLLSSAAGSIWQFYFTYGVLGGIGFIALGFVPHTALISNWFQRKVGLALGVAFSGVGVGTATVVPLCQYLIDLWGWRTTMMILGGAILLVLAPLTAVVQVARPEDLGLQPDGQAPAAAPERGATAQPQAHAASSRAPAAWTLQRAVGEPRFWSLFVVLVGGGYALQAVQTHHVALLTDVGIPALKAAFLFSVLSLSRMGGQLFWGALSDRLDRTTAYSLSSLSFMLGIVLLMLVRTPPSLALVYGYAILFGFGSGALSSIPSAMSADLFRGGHFGLIFGVLDTGFQLGTGAGSWVSGLLFDAFQNYQLALGLAACGVLVSCLSGWIVALPRRWARSPSQEEPA